MDYTISTNDHSVNVNLQGNMGFADNTKFRRISEAIINAKAPQASIDLTHLQFIDSAGLGMFLLLREQMQEANKTLVLRNPCGQVQKVFDLSNFYHLFTVG